VVAPILFGLDKFFNRLTQWPKFLNPMIADQVPIDVFMRVIGSVEIAAGLLVFFKPRIGALVVAGWLFAVIVNLLLIPGYFDIALRDVGLMLAALALASLSRAYSR
jgi:predicted RND superfamily exporter protein